MIKRIITGVLLFVITFAVTGAQEQESTTTVKLVNVPESYTVIKGDTLWGITERYLGDPLGWPDVWKRNEFIVNPHLIFPGQTIRLRALIQQVLEIEEPIIETVIEKKPVKKAGPLFISSAPQPVDSLKMALLTTTNTDVDNTNIIQALGEPRRVFTEKSFMRTGIIIQRSDIPKPSIQSIEDEKSSATKFDIVVIDIGGREGIAKDDILAAVEVGEPVKHPDTGKHYGVVIRVKGVMKVVSFSERKARCLVLESFDPIEANDPVMPYHISRGPWFNAWVKPDEIINGTILAIHEPMLSIHINDIIYLDRGSIDSVRPGDRFAIYSSEESKDTAGHKKILGIVEAINVMANETAVIVLSLKGEHIGIGDHVELTARCRIIN